MLLVPVKDHLPKTQIAEIPEHWREFAEMATGYIDNRKAKSTQRCYIGDANLFTAWCDSIHACALPARPEVVAMYISHIASLGRKVSTIERRLAAIRFMHKTKGHESPTSAECVHAVLEGIRRTKGCAPKKKAAAYVHYVVDMINQCPSTIAGDRDRALFATCLAGAFRGSEPLSLDIDDLDRVPEGYIITLRRSKTDQTGAGKLKGIMNGQHIRCADLLHKWIAVLSDAGIHDGPLFRPINRGQKIETRPEKCRLGSRSFLNLVKHYAAEAGLDPHVFGTHSFRRGFVTEAYEHDADASDTMGVTGHSRFESMREYQERKDLFSRNPGRLFL